MGVVTSLQKRVEQLLQNYKIFFFVHITFKTKNTSKDNIYYNSCEVS